jgi:hypothetical protein
VSSGFFCFTANKTGGLRLFHFRTNCLVLG